MSEIKTALTPEEWAEARGSVARGVSVGHHLSGKLSASYGLNAWTDDEGCLTIEARVVGCFDVPEDERPALAALALHGQPFGFTHEDVTILRQVAELLYEADFRLPDVESKDAVRSVADRIEALLPPREV